jgi:N-acetylglucosaminyldiphosphoundecaprenol N-acetyl-beta-D-mannosaminyltransferase
MEGIRRVDVLGLPFDAISFDETMRLIERCVATSRRLRIAPGSIDFVMKARRDPSFASLLRTFELIIADGVPITWAASLLGTPLLGRVAGTDMVWRMAEISARSGARVAMVGGAPGVADRAAARMRQAFPGADLHPVPTPMTLDAEANRAIRTRIRDSGAKIVLVALGAPRQERWIAEHMDDAGATIGSGIGSAFDIISGDRPRAPKWMADGGLEWLHRMMQDPKRLGRRYLIEDTPFMWHLAKAVVSRRVLRRG